MNTDAVVFQGILRLPVARVDSGVSWKMRSGRQGSCSCRTRLRHVLFSSGVQDNWYSLTSLVSSGSYLQHTLLVFGALCSGTTYLSFQLLWSLREALVSVILGTRVNEVSIWHLKIHSV
jgi:hypothetical protein